MKGASVEYLGWYKIISFAKMRFSLPNWKANSLITFRSETISTFQKFYEISSLRKNGKLRNEAGGASEVPFSMSPGF